MTKRPIVFCLWGLAWLLAATELHALDPHRVMTQYVIKDWRRDSGLPSNSVIALAQTADRYLWVGTNAGLSRFDGVRFVPIAAAEVRGGVAALAAAPDGSLWIGAQAGHLVRRGKDGRFTVPDGFRGGFGITALLPTRDGVIWVATLGAGIYRFQGGRFDQQQPLGQTEILAMLEDREGVLWMGGRGSGLLRLQGGRWTRYGAADGLPGESIRSLHQDSQGDLWIGTESGLSRMQGGRFTNFGREQGLAHSTVNALLSDQDGNLWVGTQAGGLQRFANGRFATLTHRDGLADDSVGVMLKDHEQNLWIGTADGLNRLSDGRFTTFGRAEGLGDATVPTVVEGRDGDIWVGTESAGVFKIHGTEVRPLGVLPNLNVMGIHEARDGGLWVTTADSRLFRVKDGSATEVSPLFEGTPPKISTMIEDDEGLIVAGSTVGLGRIRGREFVRLHPQTPKIHFIFTIIRNARGDFWLGTNNGLVRVQDGVYKTYTMDDGLPNNIVRSISPEADGSLWLATAGGLSRFQAGKFQNVTSREGLPPEVLRVVLDDKQGNLWISSVGHIFRLAKSEIQDLFDKKITEVRPFPFDTSDGLRTTEVPRSAYAGLRGRDGRLWFATARGASVIAPGQAAVDSTPPPIMIEEVAVDGGKPLAPLAVYPPGQGRFDISFTALTFRAPERVSFRYKMDREEWNDAGTARSARYPLSPGTHTFHVIATNSDGIWATEGAKLTFRLKPHWYQHWLFRAFLVLFVGACVAAIYLWRVSEYKSRQAELATKVEERTAALQHEIVEHKQTEVRLQEMVSERQHAQEEAQEYARKLADSNVELLEGQKTLQEQRAALERENQERQRAEAEARASAEKLALSNLELQGQQAALERENQERQRAEAEARAAAEKLTESNRALQDQQAALERENRERERAQEEASRERDLLHALMDNIPDLIYFKDTQSRFVRINRAHAAALGAPSIEAALGKTDLDFFADDFAHDALRDEQELFRSGRPVLDKVEHDLRNGRWMLATKVPLRNAAGEIAGLVGITRDITERKNAEDKLAADLRAFQEVVTAVADGDLTRRGVESEETVGRIARSVNEMLARFSAIFADVRDAAFSVSTASTQILAAATEISKGAQYGRDQVHTTTSAVEEMAISMAQVSRIADSSAEKARLVLDHVTQSDRAVGAASTGMTKIDAAVTETANKMRLLEERSQEIFEIIDLMEEIAAQSKLLSLNAAIEAAHAGDAGRGFSVVAEEVRRLADSSSEATKDVSRRIEGIVKETKAVLGAMENAMHEVKEGTSLSERAGRSLSEISTLMKDSTDLAQQISGASQEQAQATKTVSEAMQTIANVTSESAAGASETSRAVRDLVSLSDQLNRIMSRFKIDESGPPAGR
jgi:PAS domain S-box-containing protein